MESIYESSWVRESEYCLVGRENDYEYVSVLWNYLDMVLHKCVASLTWASATSIWLWLLILLVESADIVPEYFWACDDLVQEFRVRQYSVVDFIKFLFIINTF